jgi:hypothetical protein
MGGRIVELDEYTASIHKGGFMQPGHQSAEKLSRAGHCAFGYIPQDDNS